MEEKGEYFQTLLSKPTSHVATVSKEPKREKGGGGVGESMEREEECCIVERE